jgi:hypothetical protein
MSWHDNLEEPEDGKNTMRFITERQTDCRDLPGFVNLDKHEVLIFDP